MHMMAGTLVALAMHQSGRDPVLTVDVSPEPPPEPAPGSAKHAAKPQKTPAPRALTAADHDRLQQAEVKRWRKAARLRAAQAKGAIR
jgi:hypothetical protein